MDMDLVERFHIDYQVMCRWLLSVKKNYRSVTYHNWRHAFNVAQMMFSIITVSVVKINCILWLCLNTNIFLFQATQWWKIFGDLECLALIIACLCHDLDHRGTNNSFQIKWEPYEIFIFLIIIHYTVSFRFSQSFLTIGAALLYFHYGTSSFRSVFNDTKQSSMPYHFIKNHYHFTIPFYYNVFTQYENNVF